MALRDYQPMLKAQQIVLLQDRATEQWHRGPMDVQTDTCTQLVLENHEANFHLWHEEDKARDPYASCNQTAEVKHAIDRLNQRRNDVAEQIDNYLLSEAPQLTADARQSIPLHSETPGMMIDRLSILSLKIFHTHEESVRHDAHASHRQRNLDRLTLLKEQRTDLAACLDVLWTEVLNGTRRFKLYRQMKMYNDPELNPVLYSSHGS
jgi:hypothetical protein